MTPDDLQRLRELEARATPGPWEDCDGEIEGVCNMVSHGNVNTVARTGETYSKADAELICRLRNAAPALIAAAEERDRLREECERLRKAANAHSYEERRKIAGLDVPCHSLDAPWRSDNPPAYENTKEWHNGCLSAILDALTSEGIAAWSGDGTCCVLQIVTAFAKQCATLREQLAKATEERDQAREAHRLRREQDSEIIAGLTAKTAEAREELKELQQAYRVVSHQLERRADGMDPLTQQLRKEKYEAVERAEKAEAEFAALAAAKERLIKETEETGKWWKAKWERHQQYRKELEEKKEAAERAAAEAEIALAQRDAVAEKRIEAWKQQAAESAAALTELQQTTADLCEKCGWSMLVPGDGCKNCQAIESAAALERAQAVLREVEWIEVIVDAGTRGVYECPICCRRREYYTQSIPHAADCKLAAALATTPSAALEQVRREEREKAYATMRNLVRKYEAWLKESERGTERRRGRCGAAEGGVTFPRTPTSPTIAGSYAGDFLFG